MQSFVFKSREIVVVSSLAEKLMALLRLSSRSQKDETYIEPKSEGGSRDIIG